MAADDWRRRGAAVPVAQPERNIALRDALRPIAKRHSSTVSAVAVAWAIHWPGITAAIVGARSPQQVDGWIGGASLKLSSDDLEEIYDALNKTGAGKGPVAPNFARV